MRSISAIDEDSIHRGRVELWNRFQDDCARADIWELQRASTVSAFELFDTRVQRNLDIETGATTDGTRAIVYSALGLRNQQFRLEERDERVIQLVPLHAETSCVADVAPSPEIFACDPGATEQEWELLSEVCE